MCIVDPNKKIQAVKKDAAFKNLDEKLCEIKDGYV